VFVEPLSVPLGQVKNASQMPRASSVRKSVWNSLQQVTIDFVGGLVPKVLDDSLANIVG
jgi:hypothetical protein